MGGVWTGTAVTARTLGAREMQDVGAETAVDFPSGAGATITVETRIASIFPPGTVIAAV